MIVDDLDLFGPISRPYEADAPLRIYTDAVLALSVVSQSLKAVSRRNLQVIKNCRPVQLRKLSKGGTVRVDVDGQGDAAKLVFQYLPPERGALPPANQEPVLAE